MIDKTYLAAVALGVATYCIGASSNIFSTLPSSKENNKLEPHPYPWTVHVVPHSHDDVGWLKTLDQYFDGSRKDI